MRIPLSYLTHTLKDKVPFTVLGAPDQTLTLPRPRFLLPGDNLLPGKLYITAEQPPRIPAASVILRTPEPAHLLNLVQEIFDNCETMVSNLENVSATKDMRELLDEVETILDNPVILHKSNYSIVACSSEIFSESSLASLRGSYLPYDYVNALKRDPHFEEMLTLESPFFYNSPVSKSMGLGINLLLGSEPSYRLTVIPFLHAIQDSDCFLLTLCSTYVTEVLNSTIIAGRYADPSGRRERLIELFRIGVETDNADLTVLEQGFSSLGWLPKHEYCCLSIQIGTQDYVSSNAELLCNQLETLLPASCVFPQLNNIAVFLNLTLAGASIHKILDDCVYFFRDNDLRTGISNTFTGFVHLRFYHKQSLIALGFAARPQSFLWNQYFSDVVLDYVLEQSNRELPLHLICSQQILQLKQYDEDHQTDFYTTLECYMKNKFNAVQTAKELQIHRSTFLYRMERLQTLFGLDLNQQDSLLYILLSMKMLELSKSMMVRE